jgi:hypothetical protein
VVRGLAWIDATLSGRGKRNAGFAGKPDFWLDPRAPNLMFPVSAKIAEFQERVDTGTPLFCPVVVASKGSSLNHSA